MWQYIFTAIALVFVLEGILPALCPERWRNTLIKIVNLNNRYLRIMGLGSMLSGALLLYIINNIFK